MVRGINEKEARENEEERERLGTSGSPLDTASFFFFSSFSFFISFSSFVSLCSDGNIVSLFTNFTRLRKILSKSER